MEMQQMGTREKAGAHATCVEDGLQHGGGGPFAVGACDLDTSEPGLGRTKGLQESLNPFEPSTLAATSEGEDLLQGLGIALGRKGRMGQGRCFLCVWSRRCFCV